MIFTSFNQCRDHQSGDVRAIEMLFNGRERSWNLPRAIFEDNAGKGELGLSVGSNYQGVLGEPLRKKLEELFGLSKTLGDTLIWRDGSGGTWR